MYLISIYFDEETDKTIHHLIEKVAKATDNDTMQQVPSHMTISSFETLKEEEVIQRLESCVQKLSQDNLHFVSIGSFLPYVSYITPVLNQYLMDMSKVVYQELEKIEDISISKFYRPYQWLPHATIGKRLTPTQMTKAFETLQHQFVPFVGTVTKIGLAKTNPYRDIVVYKLKK